MYIRISRDFIAKSSIGCWFAHNEQLIDCVKQEQYVGHLRFSVVLYKFKLYSCKHRKKLFRRSCRNRLGYVHKTIFRSLSHTYVSAPSSHIKTKHDTILECQDPDSLTYYSMYVEDMTRKNCLL